MNIRQIIAKQTRAPITVTDNKTLKEVAQLLSEMKIGALPVLDTSGNLTGIISERDIVRICASTNDNPLNELVSSAMTRKLETAKADDSIESALARMTDRRIRHLPVMESGKLLAIVSIGDLVKAQIDTVIAEADAIKAYITAG